MSLKNASKNPHVAPFLVFLVVDASSMDVASNLGSMYHVFFINICLGKPTLRTFVLIESLSSHQKRHLLIRVSCFC